MFIFMVFALLNPSISKAEKVPYGSAGCGLGSMIIGTKPGFSQVFAVTSHLGVTQPAGILSGTSNCIPQKTSTAGETNVSVYFDANVDGIKLDLARGSGEHLEVLAFLSDCDVSCVKVTVDGKFADIFPSTTISSQEAARNFIALMKNNSMKCGSVFALNAH